MGRYRLLVIHGILFIGVLALWLNIVPSNNRQWQTDVGKLSLATFEDNLVPVKLRIKEHSIITVEGDGPKEEGEDSLVAYKSAHIDEAISELVIRWSHSVQGQPEAIEEPRASCLNTWRRRKANSRS